MFFVMQLCSARCSGCFHSETLRSRGGRFPCRIALLSVDCFALLVGVDVSILKRFAFEVDVFFFRIASLLRQLRIGCWGGYFRKHTLQRAKRSNQPRAKRFGVWMGDRPLVEEREEFFALSR